MRLHSGEKPYQCKVCPAKFTQFVHLKLHKRLHTRERPHKCAHCHKSYIHLCSLKVHLKGNCPVAPATGLPLEDLTRINEEIEKFDISDNADRLEDMEDNIDVTSVVEKEILAMVRKEKEETGLMLPEVTTEPASAAKLRTVALVRPPGWGLGYQPRVSRQRMPRPGGIVHSPSLLIAPGARNRYK